MVQCLLRPLPGISDGGERPSELFCAPSEVHQRGRERRRGGTIAEPAPPSHHADRSAAQQLDPRGVSSRWEEGNALGYVPGVVLSDELPHPLLDLATVRWV